MCARQVKYNGLKPIGLIYYTNKKTYVVVVPNRCAAAISAPCLNTLLYRNSFTLIKLVSNLG